MPKNSADDTRPVVERVSGGFASTQPPSPPESPVELPPRFPRTEEDAVAACATVGCPRDFVVATWNYAVSRGGNDNQGRPIQSFTHYVTGCWRFAKDREDRAVAGNGHRPSTKPTTTRNTGTLNEPSDYANPDIWQRTVK